MGRNSHYFKNKDERKAHAAQIVEEMTRDFGDAIKYSVRKRDIRFYSIIHEIPWPENRGSSGMPYDTSIYLKNMDTVSALFQMDDILVHGKSRGNPCLLNFSSYKNPGGMFLNGSSAQEESLCHESDLYCVLSDPDIGSSFYLPNRMPSQTNSHLYQSHSLFTPNIVFRRDGIDVIEYANVITCAAPNAHAARKYFDVSGDRITEHLIHRIKVVLHHAYINFCDVLILGAYGCGVFGNDPYDVAYIFNALLHTQFKGCFSAVIFAVPRTINDANYRAFEYVLEEREVSNLNELDERRSAYYGRNVSG